MQIAATGVGSVQEYRYTTLSFMPQERQKS